MPGKPFPYHVNPSRSPVKLRDGRRVSPGSGLTRHLVVNWRVGLSQSKIWCRLLDRYLLRCDPLVFGEMFPAPKLTVYIHGVRCAVATLHFHLLVRGCLPHFREVFPEEFIRFSVTYHLMWALPPSHTFDSPHSFIFSSREPVRHRLRLIGLQ